MDVHGAPTTATGDALTLVNDFVDGMVRYQPKAVNLLARHSEFADVGIISIYAGMLTMSAEQASSPADAEPFIERARQAAGLNDRELALLEMLIAWQQYDSPRAAKIAQAILARWPNDLSTLKMAHYQLFGMGQYPAMLRVAQSVAEANLERAPFHSMMAFTHEQCHQIDDAEQWANSALALESDEPWAHHALAHVHLTRGSTEEGRAVLLEASPSWNGLNSFMFTHNWWHLALFEMARDDGLDAALGIYDQYCWGVQPTYSQDQIGAVSLLTLLGFAGADVGDRWQALRPFLETRVDDVTQPFLSLQYLYGLARADSPIAEELLANLDQQTVAPRASHDRERWATIAGPAAHGVYAAANGDHRGAVDLLAPVIGRLWQIGGSHAQRDLFAQILLDAQIKAGRWTAAQQTIQLRHNWLPHHPVINRQRDQIHEALGLGRQ